MKLTNLLSLFFTITTTFLFAQDKSPNLMTIGDTQISKAEFEYIYHKNSTSTSDETSLNEYLDLFVNFKLKVHEAYQLGLDTNKAFKNELAGYRKQLAQPYLIDKKFNDNLIYEAYQRMQYDIKAQHILIFVEANATPADTLKAFKKISEIRERALKGIDFGMLMTEVKDKKDTKKKSVIAEDLGYFSAFRMVYPFETAAYNTQPGDISKIVKTRFGYHIINVLDKRPARGEIKVAHIMAQIKKAATEVQRKNAKIKIEEIYAKLQAGEKFETLAKTYSDDRGSAKKGGELPVFTTGKMVASFENAAFALKKNGEYSKPFKTPYGWHIVKRLELKKMGSFDDMKIEIKAKVAKDSRSQQSKKSLIKKIKEDYAFTENKKLLQQFNKTIDDSFVKSEWKAQKANKLKGTLFSFSDTKYSSNKIDYSIEQFAKYVEKNQKRYSKKTPSKVVEILYKSLVDREAISFEDNLLDKKYPEFKALIQEYRDGILLFELMDKKVWSKAVKDTAGLEKFYEENKGNYMWAERLEASIYNLANEEIAKQAIKILKKQVKKGFTDDFVVSELNKETQLNASVVKGVYTKEENEHVDNVTWSPGIKGYEEEDGREILVVVHKKLMPQPKLLKEARGLVIADYQTYLEAEWIKELKEKVTIKINKDVFSTIK